MSKRISEGSDSVLFMTHKVSHFFLRQGYNFTGNALQCTLQVRHQLKPALATHVALEVTYMGRGPLESKLTAVHTVFHSLLYHPLQELLNQWVHEKNNITTAEHNKRGLKGVHVLSPFPNLKNKPVCFSQSKQTLWYLKKTKNTWWYIMWYITTTTVKHLAFRYKSPRA